MSARGHHGRDRPVRAEQEAGGALRALPEGTKHRRHPRIQLRLRSVSWETRLGMRQDTQRTA